MKIARSIFFTKDEVHKLNELAATLEGQFTKERIALRDNRPDKRIAPSLPYDLIRFEYDPVTYEKKPVFGGVEWLLNNYEGPLKNVFEDVIEFTDQKVQYFEQTGKIKIYGDRKFMDYLLGTGSPADSFQKKRQQRMRRRLYEYGGDGGWTVASQAQYDQIVKGVL